MAKEAFNKKISLLKLNIELWKKFGVTFGAFPYMIQRPGH